MAKSGISDRTARPPCGLPRVGQAGPRADTTILKSGGNGSVGHGVVAKTRLANSADLPLVTTIFGGWCRVVRLVSPQSVEATLRPPVIFGCVGVAGAHGCVTSGRSVGRFFSVRSACRSVGCLYNKTIGFEKPRRDSGRGGRHRLCGRFIAGKHQ